MILLIAMVGAITLTFKKRENIKRQSYFSQIERDKISSISLEEVESDKGVKIDD
jgi:NADH-quinone oxidoreductase subunit J